MLSSEIDFKLVKISESIFVSFKADILYVVSVVILLVQKGSL